MGKTQRTYSPSLFYLGLLIGAVGLVFYLPSDLLIGSVADIPLSVFFGSVAFKSALLGSFPSFSHALASCLMLVSLDGISKRSKILFIALILAVLLTLERLMGTFDVMDVYCLLLGVSLGSLALKFRSSQSAQLDQSISFAKAIAITLGSATFAIGSYQQTPGCARFDGNVCVESKVFSTPVYMSYSDLRNAVNLEVPHDLNQIGRLYLYKSLIFMNERNQGIHIIDNRFPANPEPIAFIRIPGNLDITIRDDYLYADSYIDLVTIDLSDINDIREVNRDVDIFPFDAFQNIPNNIDFEFELVDSSKGVIVGYE